MLDDGEILVAMKALGLTPDDFVVRSKEEVDALKKRARVAYKRAAFAYHPDRNAGDPDKSKVFKYLAVVLEDIEKMEFLPEAPPRERWTFRVRTRTVRGPC